MATGSKRTTVILESEDEALLASIKARLRTSEATAMRRSIRAMAHLLDVLDAEGEVVIQRSDRANEFLSFL